MCSSILSAILAILVPLALIASPPVPSSALTNTSSIQGEHVVHFNGGLGARNLTVDNNGGNNDTIDPFTAPYGWDNPVRYKVKIVDNSSCSPISVQNQTEREITAYENTLVSALSNELETRINKSGAILEITSKLREVKSAPFVNSISPELHGIPKDVDTPKRKLAQDILAADRDFELVFFLMPSGYMYLEEPYSRQENLTRNNIAFREYYRGAVETSNTYLGNVYISGSSDQLQANITVPICSENNATLIGIWAGGLNLTNFNKSLQSLNLTSSAERMVYVDSKGQKVADSKNGRSLSIPNSPNESFANLESFKNAIHGEAGTMTEIINGTKMIVSYHPVKAFSNVWPVLFMQPYNDIKEYNAEHSKNNMENNTDNEGNFTSKKGIPFSPTNDTKKVVNDSNVVQDIPRPGVPDEARFRELKDKANETTCSNEQERVQEDGVAQYDK